MVAAQAARQGDPVARRQVQSPHRGPGPADAARPHPGPGAPRACRVIPYYADDLVTLYLGDCREVLPELGVTADCVVADPPYGETSLPWDRWQDGWLDDAAAVTRSLWCFGSLRMFIDRREDWGWKLSQDVIWEKHNGSSFHADRFKRVHEIITHWYRGDWASIYHEVPTTPDATARSVRRKQRPPHTGHIEAGSYTSQDGGTRLMR